MKNRILTFVIGVLVGAIVATVGFYCYSKNAKPMNMNGQMPEMMQRGEDGQMPEKPDGEGGGRGFQGEMPPSENTVTEQ